MSKKAITIIRITVKILLCVSLIISIGLLLNYVRNLNPTADGFDVTNIIARLIHGDDYWTWENLTAGISVAIITFGVLFCADEALDIVCSKDK